MKDKKYNTAIEGYATAEKVYNDAVQVADILHGNAYRYMVELADDIYNATVEIIDETYKQQ